jgi:hypothetical protein
MLTRAAKLPRRVLILFVILYLSVVAVNLASRGCIARWRVMRDRRPAFFLDPSYWRFLWYGCEVSFCWASMRSGNCYRYVLDPSGLLILRVQEGFA